MQRKNKQLLQEKQKNRKIQTIFLKKQNKHNNMICVCTCVHMRFVLFAVSCVTAATTARRFVVFW